MSNAKKTGRRARLLARQRPGVDYQLRVDDDAQALAELAAAKDAAESARFRTDDGAEQAVAVAEERLAAARAAVEACYEPVRLTAMTPIEFEDLIAAHPPREGKDEKWDGETFPRACFLACAPADLSADEWSEWLDTALSQGERTALLLSAVGINARWPSGAVPEG